MSEPSRQTWNQVRDVNGAVVEHFLEWEDGEDLEVWLEKNGFSKYASLRVGSEFGIWFEVYSPGSHEEFTGYLVLVSLGDVLERKILFRSVLEFAQYVEQFRTLLDMQNRAESQGEIEEHLRHGRVSLFCPLCQAVTSRADWHRYLREEESRSSRPRPPIV